MKNCFGMYKGVVKGVNDPQNRSRLQVRVAGIDWDATADGDLRWAELGAPFSALLCGDIPHYNLGDQVWVQYEAGDSDYPVVTHGWVNSQFGFPSLPSGQTTKSNPDARLRWIRADRVGNKVVMSEIPEELWIQLVSGAVSITVRQADNSIRLYALSGLIDLSAARLTSTSQNIALSGNTFLMTSSAVDAAGGAQGLIRLLSNLNLDIFAGPGPNSRLNIGGYVPTFQGLTDPTQPTMAAQQTAEVNVLGQEINAGAGPSDTQGLPTPIPLQPTEVHNIKGATITIRAAATTLTPMPSLVIDATTGEATVTSQVKVTVSAPEVDVTATVKAVVSAPEVDVTATTTVKVTAPVVIVDSPDVTLGS